MTARKLKNSWWVDFRVDYIRYRRRSPDNTQAGARAYEFTLRQRLSRGETIDGLGRSEDVVQPFEQFALAWLDEYATANNKPSERRAKEYILRSSLIPFFRGMPIGRITTRNIEQYKAHEIRRGISRKTINNRLTVMRKCMTSAYEWLGLQGRPPTFVWLKCPPPKTDYLTADECDRLLRVADGVVSEMILTALRTGMRAGELKGLQWESLDWQTQTITVRHSLSDQTGELGSPKSNRERYVPMHPDLSATLAGRRQDAGYVFLDTDGRRFNHARMSRRLAAACKSAQLRHIGWHSLRHTFASQLAMRGVPLGAVQLLLGHSSVTTTMRYAHMAPSILRKAIEVLGAGSDSFGQPVGNRWLQPQKAA